MDTSDGFRFVPSSVLRIAVQAREKQNYQVVSRDTDGRPAVVRMKSSALTIATRSYPVYPESARTKHISGQVTVSARIGKDGRVTQVNAKAGPPELQKAALDCVKKWRVKSVQIDGYPVEVETEFLVGFALG